MISPRNHHDVVLLPHLHLAMLLDGSAERYHQISVLSFFNLGTILLSLSAAKTTDFEAAIFEAQKNVAALEPDAAGHYHLHDPAARARVGAVTCALDRYMGIQNEAVLARGLRRLDDILVRRTPGLATIITMEEAKRA